MAYINRRYVGEALDLFLDGMVSFVMDEFRQQYGEEAAAKIDEILKDDRSAASARKGGQIHWDTKGIFKLIEAKWKPKWKHLFGDKLGKSERAMLHELDATRNRWAHQEPFSTRDTLRALDTAQRLLQAVGANDQAGKVEELIRKVELGDSQRPGKDDVDTTRRPHAEPFSPTRQKQDLSRWSAIPDGSARIDASKPFVGREALIREISGILADDRNRILIIVGQPGRGKTRLLQEVLSRGMPEQIGAVFPFFFSASTSSMDPKRWLQSFYGRLLHQFAFDELDESIFRAESSDLLLRLRERLNEISAEEPRHRILFAIDAVDESHAAGNDVISFVDEGLPPAVTVVATARPGYLPTRLTESSPESGIHVLDLEAPDRLSVHRSDGRRYVEDRLGRLDISEDLSANVAKLGDGNFLVLEKVCAHVDELRRADEIQDYLTRLKNRSADPLRAVYEDWWDRLEQTVDAERLDSLLSMAALLASARIPVTWDMIRDLLGGGRAELRLFNEHLAEYVTEIEHPHLEGEAVYRLYHETLAAFVRSAFEHEITLSQKRLADFCADRARQVRDSYSYEDEYALRFAVSHLVSVGRWDDLEALLTDLRFIQAKLTSGQAYELLEDFDDSLRAHPETGEKIRRRDEAARRWVRELVDYSRSCTMIRERHARGELADPIEEISKLPFPSPPSTEEVERAMREAEYASKRGHEAPVPEFEQFARFVRESFIFLKEFPSQTSQIARDCVWTAVNEKAQGLIDHSRATLERPVPKPSAPGNTLVLQEFLDEDPPRIWMTPDASVGFGNYAWDLRSGRRLLPERSAGSILAATADATFVACWEKLRNSVELVNIRTGSVVAELPDSSAVLGMGGMTPDGSVLAFINTVTPDSGTTSLTVWFPFEGIDFSFWIDEFTPDCVLIASSGTIVMVGGKDESGDFRGRFFDLIDQSVVIDVQNRQWIKNEMGEAMRWQDQLTTADGALSVQQLRSDEESDPDLVEIIRTSDNTVVRSFGSGRGFDRIDALSADGRFAFASTETSCCLLDLADGVVPQSAHRVEKDSATGWARAAPDAPATGHAAATLESQETALARELGLVVRYLAEWPDGSQIMNEIEYYFAEFDAKDAEQEGPIRYMIVDRASDRQCLWRWPDVHVPLPTLDASAWLADSSEQEHTEAQVVDMSSGERWTIGAGMRLVGWTRDCRAAIFIAEQGLRLWGLASRDWLQEAPQRHYAEIDPRKSTKLRIIEGHSSFWPTSDDGVVTRWPNVCASPDGRLILAEREHPILIRVGSTDHVSLPELVWTWCLKSAAFSPDGRYLATSWDYEPRRAVGLWCASTGECLGIVRGCAGNDLAIDCDGILHDREGEDCGLRIAVPEPIVPWVTGARLYRLATESEPAIDRKTPLFPEGRIPGRFDDVVTFRCQRCSRWAPLPQDVLDVINSIHKAANIGPEDSPVLSLPDDAWDNEPGLLFECPNCHQPHRSTPFVVDRLQNPA